MTCPPMKFFKSVTLALALTASVSYADTKTDAPKTDAPKTDVSSADIKKFLAFFDKIVDAVVTNKDDCTKMASSITSVIDANKDVLEMAKKAKADGKQLPDDAKKHIEEGAKKMMPAMMAKCANDKGVQAAFERLD